MKPKEVPYLLLHITSLREQQMLASVFSVHMSNYNSNFKKHNLKKNLQELQYEQSQMRHRKVIKDSI